MSDTSQGPGWWQASDGKWYAPELYPKDWPVPNPADELEAATSDVATSIVVDTDSGSAEVPQAAPTGVVGEPAAVTNGAAEVAEAIETPNGWASPDTTERRDDTASPITAPARDDDPTQLQGVVADPTLDPTTVQPALTPSTEPSIWDTPPAADTPAVGVATEPPASWDEAPPVAVPYQSDMEAPPEAAPSGEMPGGIIGILGGGALVVGSFLPWATAVGPNISGEINGLTGSNGWGTLICGLIVAICAALAMAGQRKWWVGGAMLGASLVGIGLAVFSMFDINSTSDDLPGTLRDGGVAAEIADATSLDLDTGLWIVLAGGAVSLVASLIVLARRQ